MHSRVNIAIIGRGGDGVMTLGETLVNIASYWGYYGIMTKASGPQIRGGESASFVRISNKKIESPARKYHIIIVLDAKSLEQFSSEIKVRPSTVLIYNSSDKLDEKIKKQVSTIIPIDFKEWKKTKKGSKENILVLGVIGSILGFPQKHVHKAIKVHFTKHSQQIVDSCIDTYNFSYEQTKQNSKQYTYVLQPPLKTDKKKWLITGNQSTALGALWAGVKFVGAYPITPATEILEWLAPNIKKIGGQLIQAEDELSSIGMVVGASYGGTPALTATSGPGLSLMSEIAGLSIMAEIPTTIINVMRGGPSTGIPTKSEQSDLNIALYGMHGDAPHIVVAPNNIVSCMQITNWAVYLAEKLQTLSIVLTDQALGQTKIITDEPQITKYKAKRKKQPLTDQSYNRYQITKDFISPMSVPGQKGLTYTATGLEHEENSRPTSNAGEHKKQLDKRQNKLLNFDYGNLVLDKWGSDNSDITLICFGSVTSSTLDAKDLLEQHKKNVKVISIKLIMPLPKEQLLKEVGSSKNIYVVEQNHSGQFYNYLSSHNLFNDKNFKSIAFPGPLPIRGIDIVRLIEDKFDNL